MFNANMAMNFNVFQAAASLDLSRVVWASSETTLGLPFDVPPRYAPVDEDHYPVPTSTYALSKVASETVAGQIAQWSGIPFVAGSPSFIIAAADTVRDRPSAHLLAIDRARKVLGFEPRHSWRDHVGAQAEAAAP